MTAPSPTDIFRTQVRKVRQALGLSQQELAERLTALNGHVDRVTVVRTESGARGVSIDEAILYAAALGVSPVKLLTPDPADEMVAIAPHLEVPARRARRWLRGKEPLPGQNEETFYTQVEDEGKNMDVIQMERVAEKMLDAARAARFEAMDAHLDAISSLRELLMQELQERDR